jgi:branched-subunit amino acid ABC-type transport system permease component
LPRDATLNFAQGEMLTVSTFLAWSAQRAFGLPLVVSLVQVRPAPA